MVLQEGGGLAWAVEVGFISLKIDVTLTVHVHPQLVVGLQP